MDETDGSPIEVVPDEIDRDACLALMKTQSVGRLAVADHGYYPPWALGGRQSWIRIVPYAATGRSRRPSVERDPRAARKRS